MGGSFQKSATELVLVFSPVSNFRPFFFLLFLRRVAINRNPSSCFEVRTFSLGPELFFIALFFTFESKFVPTAGVVRFKILKYVSNISFSEKSFCTDTPSPKLEYVCCHLRETMDSLLSTFGETGM